MADAIIDIVGQEDLPLIVELYNQIYRPSRDAASVQRRFLGRHNVLRMVARVNDRPVGFFIGFEVKPTTFGTWFYGVLSDFRRQGIATQLMEAVHAWAGEEGYESVRMECHNAARPMLHLAIARGYDVTGIRYEHERADNLIIFEKVLTAG